MSGTAHKTKRSRDLILKNYAIGKHRLFRSNECLLHSPTRICNQRKWDRRMGTVVDIVTGKACLPTRRQVRLACLNRKRVEMFRNAAAIFGEGPTASTSDETIARLHQTVIQAFRTACQREMRVPPNRWKINFMVLKLLEVGEVIDAEAVEALLACEVKWYLQHGLRRSYDHELRP